MTGGHGRLKRPDADSADVTLHAVTTEDLARTATGEFDYIPVDIAHYAQMLPVGNNKSLSANMLAQTPASPFGFGLCSTPTFGLGGEAVPRVVLLLFDSTLRRLAKYITQAGRESARGQLCHIGQAERDALVLRSEMAGSTRHLLRMPADGTAPIRDSGPLNGPCRHARELVASSRAATVAILKIAYMTDLVHVRCPPRGGIIVGVGPERASTPGLDDTQVAVLLLAQPPCTRTAAEAIAFFGKITKLNIGLESGPVAVTLREVTGDSPMRLPFAHADGCTFMMLARAILDNMRTHDVDIANFMGAMGLPMLEGTDSGQRVYMYSLGGGSGGGGGGGGEHDMEYGEDERAGGYGDGEGSDNGEDVQVAKAPWREAEEGEEGRGGGGGGQHPHQAKNIAGGGQAEEPREELACYTRDACLMLMRFGGPTTTYQEMENLLDLSLAAAYTDDSVAPCYRVVFTITSAFLAHIPSGDGKVVHAVSLAAHGRNVGAVSADADVHQQLLLRETIRASHALALRQGIRPPPPPPPPPRASDRARLQPDTVPGEELEELEERERPMSPSVLDRVAMGRLWHAMNGSPRDEYRRECQVGQAVSGQGRRVAVIPKQPPRVGKRPNGKRRSVRIPAICMLLDIREAPLIVDEQVRCGLQQAGHTVDTAPVLALVLLDYISVLANGCDDVTRPERMLTNAVMRCCQVPVGAGGGAHPLSYLGYKPTQDSASALRVALHGSSSDICSDTISIFASLDTEALAKIVHRSLPNLRGGASLAARHQSDRIASMLREVDANLMTLCNMGWIACRLYDIFERVGDSTIYGQAACFDPHGRTLHCARARVALGGGRESIASAKLITAGVRGSLLAAGSGPPRDDEAALEYHSLPRAPWDEEDERRREGRKTARGAKSTQKVRRVDMGATRPSPFDEAW
jgi:hypothetical protein